MDHCPFLSNFHQDQTFTVEGMFYFSKIMKRLTTVSTFLLRPNEIHILLTPSYLKKERKLTQQELLFHSLFWKTLRQTEWLRRCQRHLEMMANVLKGNKCNFHGQVVERPGTFKYIAISKGTLVALQNMNEGSFDAQKWTDLCHHCRSRAHGDISSTSYSSRPNLP